MLYLMSHEMNICVRLYNKLANLYNNVVNFLCSRNKHTTSNDDIILYKNSEEITFLQENPREWFSQYDFAYCNYYHLDMEIKYMRNMCHYLGNPDCGEYNYDDRINYNCNVLSKVENINNIKYIMSVEMSLRMSIFPEICKGDRTECLYGTFIDVSHIIMDYLVSSNY
jgi:hypothetical protein